jgi:hypothetical protein
MISFLMYILCHSYLRVSWDEGEGDATTWPTYGIAILPALFYSVRRSLAPDPQIVRHIILGPNMQRYIRQSRQVIRSNAVKNIHKVNLGERIQCCRKNRPSAITRAIITSI